MNSRVQIAAGLLSGVLVAVLLIVALIALGPDPGPAAVSPAPSDSPPGASPTPATSTDAAPSGSPALGGIGPDIMADGLRTIMPGVDITL